MKRFSILFALILALVLSSAADARCRGPLFPRARQAVANVLHVGKAIGKKTAKAAKKAVKGVAKAAKAPFACH